MQYHCRSHRQTSEAFYKSECKPSTVCSDNKKGVDSCSNLGSHVVCKVKKNYLLYVTSLNGEPSDYVV